MDLQNATYRRLALAVLAGLVDEKRSDSVGTHNLLVKWRVADLFSRQVSDEWLSEAEDWAPRK